MFIYKETRQISIRQQCELLELNRSNIYYTTRQKDAQRKDLIRAEIDRQFVKEPCGVKKMTHYLWRRLNCRVGEKLVRKLMRMMNLLALYPKPNLSRKHPENKLYPYLLKSVEIIRANQV